MSFLSDLFEGKTSNLGNDLNPSNIFSDAGKDIGGKNTIPELLGGAALLTGGIGLAGGLGAVGADLGFGTAADAGLSAADAATASTLPDWLTTTDFGSTLGATGTDALSFTGDATATAPGISAIDSAIAPNAATATTDATFAGDATESQLLAGTGIDGNTAGNFVGAATNAAPGSNAAAGGGSFFDKLVSGAFTSLTKNPLGIAIAGGALGYDVLKGNPNSAQETQLNNEAGQLISQGQSLTANGQQLQTYLTNGTLPPGQQAAVTQAVQAAKAKIIANAAANGQNTNPTQNSALAQDLAAADMNGLAMAGTLETQLAQTGTSLINSGLNATGLSSEIYQALVKIDQTNNNQLMTAIASMAAALGGGTKISSGSNTFSITPTGA